MIIIDDPKELDSLLQDIKKQEVVLVVPIKINGTIITTIPIIIPFSKLSFVFIVLNFD